MKTSTVPAGPPPSVAPSIVTGTVIGGSGVVGLIVCGPPPGIAKTILAAPAPASADWIAVRNDPAPLLAFVVTVYTRAPGSWRQFENSEVSPSAVSVTVAVIHSPGLTGAVMMAPVSNVGEPGGAGWNVPRYRAPSPLPEGSHDPLA